MNDCTRCHGAGYLYITNGDNDHECKECLGTGENLDDLIQYYTLRYRNAYLLTIEQRADWHELELMKDKLWYQRGLYAELGCDRAGISYRLVESDTDDNLVIEAQFYRELQKQTEIERMMR